MAGPVNLEHLVGTGYIFNGPIQMCRTRYRVDTYVETSEEMVRNAHLMDRLKEIRGKINPIELSLDNLFGGDCTLVLEDGRRLDFFITETITGNITPTTGLRS